ncbi:hypothetical protein GC194_08475 [bacterium]|nr:hypothetical protein [bacterium]
MKVKSIIIAILLFPIWVHAECLNSGIRVYPTSNELAPEGWIILEGFALSESVIYDIGDKYPVYMVGENERIELEVVRIEVGMYRLTQAILKPVRTLEIGKTYFLKIDNMDKIHRYAKRYNAPIWTIVDHAQTFMSDKITMLQQTGSSYIRYGCGPEVFGLFQLNHPTSNNYFIMVELFDNENDTVNTYTFCINGLRDSLLQIGHDMCSGAFKFQAGCKYKIRLKYMNDNGSRVSQWTNWFDMKNPLDE